MPVVLVEKDSPQISVVTLNRPERRNALTLELLTELCAAINVASEQPEQRVLIFRGAGAAFCTGLDLKEAADQKKAHATAEMVANTLVAISQTRLVTIGAVHGAAVAGGADADAASGVAPAGANHDRLQVAGERLRGKGPQLVRREAERRRKDNRDRLPGEMSGTGGNEHE